MSVSLIDGHIDPDTNRMTEKQIIKAWEDAKKYEFVPNEFFIDETLDLINRQQAEIERLTAHLEELNFLESRVNSIKNTPKDTFTGILISMAEGVARYEAVKEFEERLKEKANKTKIVYVADTTVQEQEIGWYQISIADFDNLVKEMVGEG